MKNEKLSKIVDKYSDSLKKYGVYLLLILFFFAFSLNYFLGKTNVTPKELEAELEPIDIPFEIAQVEENIKDEADVSIITINKNQHPVNSPAKELEVQPTVGQATETSVEPEIIPVVVSGPVATPKPLKLSWPVQGEVINKFGMNYSKTYGDYRMHQGLDIETEPGMNITATYGGRVILVEKNEMEKFIVEIKHENGWISRYSHLDQVVVKAEQKIDIGEKIGQVGTPGLAELDEGSHLHFQIKEKEEWIDPLEHLTPSPY